jgi:hypothetical protein
MPTASADDLRQGHKGRGGGGACRACRKDLLVGAEVEVDGITQAGNCLAFPRGGPEVYDTSRNLIPSGVVAPSIETASARRMSRASMRSIPLRRCISRFFLGKLFLSVLIKRKGAGSAREGRHSPLPRREPRSSQSGRGEADPPPPPFVAASSIAFEDVGSCVCDERGDSAGAGGVCQERESV